MYAEGVAVEIVSVARNDPRAIDPAVKSGNYLNNVLALGEARRRSGAYEAILCAPSGSVAEGATSNVFAVLAGEVRTPALAVGILDGVTRGKVLALCRQHGMPWAEVDLLAPDEVRSAQEVFITSATRGVLPVTMVDRQPVGDGRPGPITRRLLGLYRALAGGGAPMNLGVFVLGGIILIASGILQLLVRPRPARRSGGPGRRRGADGGLRDLRRAGRAGRAGGRAAGRFLRRRVRFDPSDAISLERARP